MKNLKELRGTGVVKSTAKSMADSGSYYRAQLDTAEEKLKDLGWYTLGQGANAKVFGNPSYPYVLKLFSTDDYCYRAFLTYAIANQSNPLLPKVRGKLLRITNDILAVRLEKLTKISEMEFAKYDRILTELFNNIYLLTSGSDHADEVFRNIQKKFPKYTNFIKTMIDIFSKVRCDPDLHAGNFMLRGKQIVVIDPVFE